VRLVHGQQLPNPGNARNGFTLATPFPVYILGNYNVQTNGGSPVLGTNNTSSTYPAAIMGDAVTILSVLWNDANSITKISSGPVADDTTVNAAMLEGIVESVPGGDYSGGADNFLRMLENWNNQTLTYNGSIVVLFDSNYATNAWKQIHNYYDKPNRNWSFDLNFTHQPLLPPLTPSIKAMIRGQWMTQ
jgi:hypothetical protein